MKKYFILFILVLLSLSCSHLINLKNKYRSKIFKKSSEYYRQKSIQRRRRDVNTYYSKRYSEKKFNLIKKGMSKSEVLNIIGPPIKNERIDFFECMIFFDVDYNKLDRGIVCYLAPGFNYKKSLEDYPFLIIFFDENENIIEIKNNKKYLSKHKENQIIKLKKEKALIKLDVPKIHNLQLDGDLLFYSDVISKRYQYKDPNLIKIRRVFFHNNKVQKIIKYNGSNFENYNNFIGLRQNSFVIDNQAYYIITSCDNVNQKGLYDISNNKISDLKNLNNDYLITSFNYFQNKKIGFGKIYKYKDKITPNVFYEYLDPKSNKSDHFIFYYNIENDFIHITNSSKTSIPDVLKNKGIKEYKFKSLVSDLNLRRNPEFDCKIIYKIKKNEVINFLEIGDDVEIYDAQSGYIRGAWMKCKVGKYKGWCFSGYLEPVFE